MTTISQGQPEAKLNRVLSLKDLVIYGIILIQPVAALPLFGHANHLSKGHAVTAILVSMIGMIFTAISYGKMANLYPAAGSAYTYVSKGIHPYLGFVTGWSMFMDYLFLPIICTIYGAITASHLIPIIPYRLWLIVFATIFTLVNMRGIKMAALTNTVLMIVMTIVVFYFMTAAASFIVHRDGIHGLFSTRPFYNPPDFSFPAMASATALAALTYIGFDGITTLSEEVKNPKRNVMLAAVFTCVITGIWSGAQVYLAQLSWPDWNSFTAGFTTESAKNDALDTAIMSVARRVGGITLDLSLTIILLVADIGSGMTALTGASRLLFGMGRDGIIPKKFFGHLDKKYQTPNYNILLIGAITLCSSFFFNYEESARLINFGAFFAFMAVNIASMREYYFKSKNKSVKSFFVDFLPAGVGFCICLFIWLNLPLKTFIIGGTWMVAGIIYLSIWTKGFRKPTPVISFS
ncbi:MAG: APC family permease [Bacteroidetes bacterium]|nr:MAG: APC family permease [Bacteroidota bacterium]